MRPVLFIGAAAIAIIGVAAIAFAASGNEGGRDNALGNQIPPAATPMPVEPDGGIGDTPSDQPLPVEPDGGIGDTPSEQPLPVEPDGGIGDTPGKGPDAPTTDSDKPMPTEPVFTVTPSPALPGLPAGRYAEAAPIDGIDLRVAESYPVQYFLNVQAGLPSGCAQQYTHSFTRNGNLIEVEVLNSFPEGNPACTAIYGMYEVNVALGSDYVPGQVYTISVNNGAAEMQFTAQ